MERRLLPTKGLETTTVKLANIVAVDRGEFILATFANQRIGNATLTTFSSRSLFINTSVIPCDNFFWASRAAVVTHAPPLGFLLFCFDDAVFPNDKGLRDRPRRHEKSNTDESQSALSPAAALLLDIGSDCTCSGTSFLVLEEVVDVVVDVVAAAAAHTVNGVRPTILEGFVMRYSRQQIGRAHV